MRAPGEQIDVWVVDAALGQGGMGSVYRCHNVAATRILAAIKVLDLDTRNNPRLRARFIREAEILFALDHPNIVKVRNVRMDAEPPYIEMEFVNGESLEDRIGRSPLSAEEAQRILGPVADALDFLHCRGIRHRDIKPSNILIQHNGVARLVDFGIATEVDRGTVSEGNQALGSAWYVPPEWVRPNELDPVQWDIYAFGVVLYEALTGQSAFPVPVSGSPGQRFLQVLMAKQGHAPLDPGPMLPVDLRALVRDMTVSDVSARVRSAAEVAARMRSADLQRIDPGWRFVAASRADTATWTGEDPGALMREAVMMPSGAPPRNAVDASVGAGVTAVVPDLAMEQVQAPVRTAPVPEVPRADGGRTLGPRPSSPTLVSQELVSQDIGTVPPGVAPTRSRWPLVAGAAGLMFVLGLGAVGVVVWALSLQQVEARPVDVAVTGLPAGVPVQVMIGDQAGVGRDGVYRVDAVAPGEVTIRLALGEGCSPTGPVDVVCGYTETRATVVPGEGAHTVVVPAPAPGVGTVQVQAGVPAFRARVEGGAPVDPVGGIATISSMNPGRHPIVVEAGTCPADVVSCARAQSCPPGCEVWTGEAVVPWAGGVVAINASLNTTISPVAASGTTSGTPVSPTEPPKPTPTVPNPAGSNPAGSNPAGSNPAGSTPTASNPAGSNPTAISPATNPTSPPVTATVQLGAGNLVTVSQLSRWLAEHPEWLPGGEKAGGPGYLEGWTGSTPPAGASGVVVDVSWALANSYCAGRGGLASIDAEPTAWTVSDSHPWHELRSREGAAAWRRSDGTVSKGLTRNETMPEAGFRCVK